MQTADFTIADVLAWARTKPADEAYCYHSCGGCAVASFLNETGRTYSASVGSDYWRDDTGLTHAFPDGLEDAVLARGEPGKEAARVFGKLVARLETLLPAEPLSDTWTTPDAYLTDIEDVARERCSA